MIRPPVFAKPQPGTRPLTEDEFVALSAGQFDKQLVHNPCGEELSWYSDTRLMADCKKCQLTYVFDSPPRWYLIDLSTRIEPKPPKLVLKHDGNKAYYTLEAQG